jgi:hypothetical protein
MLFVHLLLLAVQPTPKQQIMPPILQSADAAAKKRCLIHPNEDEPGQEAIHHGVLFVGVESKPERAPHTSQTEAQPPSLYW